MKAQGSALGRANEYVGALKGRSNPRHCVYHGGDRKARAKLKA